MTRLLKHKSHGANHMEIVL